MDSKKKTINFDKCPLLGKDETRSILVNIWFQWKPGMNPNGNQTHIMVNDLECGKGKPEDAIRRGVSHVYYHGILNCVEYDSKQPLASNPTFLIPQRSIPTYSYHIDDLEFEVIVTTYIEVSRQLYRVDISREGMLRDSICYAVIAGVSDDVIDEHFLNEKKKHFSFFS